MWASEQKPGPTGAVDAFTDPKTGEQVWVVPAPGESPEEAIKRVRAAHGVPLLPELGGLAGPIGPDQAGE